MDCQRQSYCDLAAILKNGRLTGGHARKLFLYGLNSICANLVLVSLSAQISVLRSSTIRESGEIKFAAVSLVLLLASCFLYDMIDCPIHVLFKCSKVNKIQKDQYSMPL